MSVIRKPPEGTRSVLQPTMPGAAVTGQGELTFVCGGCRSVLLENVDAHQVQNIVVRCFDCGAHNETLD